MRIFNKKALAWGATLGSALFYIVYQNSWNLCESIPCVTSVGFPLKFSRAVYTYGPDLPNGGANIQRHIETSIAKLGADWLFWIIAAYAVIILIQKLRNKSKI